MRISLSTASLLHFSLSTTLSLVKEVGFDGVELAIGPEQAIGGIASVRRLADSFQLPILSVHQPMMRLPGWGDKADIILKSIDWANELDCEVITFHPPGSPDGKDESWTRFVSAIEKGKSRSRDKLKITIENRVYLPGTSYGKRFYLDEHNELLECAASLGVAVTFDTSHAWVTDGDIIEPYRRFRGLLANVHFSDVNTRNLPPFLILLHTLITQHQLPGTGVLPLRELLGEMANDGYEGLVTLEISPVALKAWSRGSAKRNLATALNFCNAARISRSSLIPA